MRILNHFFIHIFLGCILLSALLLGGCTSITLVEVTNFHQLPKSQSQKASTLEGQPGTGQVPSVLLRHNYQWADHIAQELDPERQFYTKLIEQELEKAGFINAAPNEYTFDYQLNTPRTFSQGMQALTYPAYPCGGLRRGGFCGGGTFYQSVTYEIYTNTLELFLSDAKTKKRIWQSRAQTDSLGGASANRLLPLLVRGALNNFPGENGKTTRLEFKRDSQKDTESFQSEILKP